jgi:hypothetical protein
LPLNANFLKSSMNAMLPRWENIGVAELRFRDGDAVRAIS